MIMEVQEDVVDTFLRYGLFIGAVFQLICIGAVIVMPDNKAECCHDSDCSEDERSISDQGSPHISPHHKHHRQKRDKKKRR